jgi:putative glutamine amidotransferase
MPPLIGISAETAPVTRYWGTEEHHVVDADYVSAVRAGGGHAVVLPVGDPGDVDALVDRLDGLVLTGGNDIDPARYGQARVDAGTGGDLDPARDAFDVALVHAALRWGVPTLAVCRGLQVVNVALGGSLVQHLADHPQTRTDGSGGHLVVAGAPQGSAGERFRRRFGDRLHANSYHHQAVDRPGEGVTVVARADDGVVEAIEVAGAPDLVAVQWHPETLRHRPEHLAFFRWLAEAAGSPTRPRSARQAARAAPGARLPSA